MRTVHKLMSSRVDRVSSMKNERKNINPKLAFYVQSDGNEFSRMQSKMKKIQVRGGAKNLGVVIGEYTARRNTTKRGVIVVVVVSGAIYGI